MRRAINWEIEEERRYFFRQLDTLVKNWTQQLPNLRDIFRPDEIDWLLKESVWRHSSSFIYFAVRTGYKDEPTLDQDGKPLVRRATAVHLLCIASSFDAEIFKIYDRLDVNYIDESGLTHYHVACKQGLQDVVRGFLELSQDPNGIQPGTGDSPLHFAAKHGFNGVVELLLRRGANPNSANAQGLTPLRIIYKESTAKMLFELSNERYRPVLVDARDNEGWTPLHVALAEGCKKMAELLLRLGADPNLANAEGETSLHVICQLSRDVDNVAESFIKVCDDLQRTVHIDARDRLGRTPLQRAVSCLWPDVVRLLLDRRADLSSFVFPTESHFDQRFKPCPTYTFYKFNYILNFELVSSAMAVIECLEEKGYALELGNVLTIIKLFAKHGAFDTSVNLELDNKKFTSKAKEIRIIPNLYLYDLIQLKPKEAANLLTYTDYYKFTCSQTCKGLYNPHHVACVMHPCKKLPKEFFRRWTLYPFWEQILHYRLPILCCDMIIEWLSNKDLYHICLAATTQSDESRKKIQYQVQQN
uniref:Ankyrin repeat domain-containing protein 54 n=1 Tax=Trichogramma kaykai TaxID=54128 RepID=A0ABD2WWX7_9HYME